LFVYNYLNLLLNLLYLNPLYWDAIALKPKYLEIDAPYRFLVIYLFVGYTIQFIDILKSYFNLNKYTAQKRVLWCIYFQVLGF